MDCNAAHKVELTQVLYPVFVHVYLDLIAGGHSGIGTYMNSSIRTQPSSSFYWFYTLPMCCEVYTPSA